MRTTTLTATVIVLFASQLVNAQSILRGDPANWQWQASVDNGQTWTPGLVEIAATVPRVRVRAFLTFPPPNAQSYFGGVLLDPYVQGMAGAGAADTITDITRGQIPYTIQHLAVMRFGNIIKIDDDFDFLPPGVGTRWAQCSQPPNNGMSPRPLFLNPVNVFEYILNLDGTQGERLVTAAWSTDTVFQLRPHFTSFVWGIGNEFDQFRHPVIEEQLTIRVIPTSASASIFALAGVLAARRRRRVER